MAAPSSGREIPTFPTIATSEGRSKEAFSSLFGGLFAQ